MRWPRHLPSFPTRRSSDRNLADRGRRLRLDPDQRPVLALDELWRDRDGGLTATTLGHHQDERSGRVGVDLLADVRRLADRVTIDREDAVAGPDAGRGGRAGHDQSGD